MRIYPDARCADRILASRAFAFDEPRGLLFVRPCNPAGGISTDAWHDTIVDPRHEFVTLACRCHWTCQTDGDGTEFKRFAMTGGSADRGMDEFVRSHANYARRLFGIAEFWTDEYLKSPIGRGAVGPTLTNTVSVRRVLREADRDADIIRHDIACCVEPWSEQADGCL
jgi:hypothetical protein